MKKFFVLMSILLLASATNAKEYQVKKGLKANIWNDLLGGMNQQGMHLSYDTEIRQFLWYIDYTMLPIVVLLSDDVRDSTLEYISKYKEWNKKASQKGVKVDKEIGTLPPTTVWFKYGDVWHPDISAKIQIKFFSQSTQRHQLIVSLGTLESSYNEFISHQPDTLYLWWKDVIAFEKAIGDSAYREYLEEVKRKQSIEEDFQ